MVFNAPLFHVIKDFCTSSRRYKIYDSYLFPPYVTFICILTPRGKGGSGGKYGNFAPNGWYVFAETPTLYITLIHTVQVHFLPCVTTFPTPLLYSLLPCSLLSTLVFRRHSLLYKISSKADLVLGEYNPISF